MSKIIYIFIYNDEIIKYYQTIKFCKGLSRYNTYKYLDKVANYGLNMLLRDKNIGDFKIDFIVWLESLPYYMYACRTTLDISNYIFRLEPIITIVEKNKFSYNNIAIANTFRCNNFIIGENITEFKIIDDGVNSFDESHLNLLDNLPFSIEKIYLLYNVIKPVNNLPFTTKKVYVYSNCNIDLIKLPFNCEIIKIDSYQ
jgi:hypothetical protein